MDKHIRRLDADLARFENELKEKLEVSGYESPDGRGIKSKLISEMFALVQQCRRANKYIVLMNFDEYFAQRVIPEG